VFVKIIIQYPQKQNQQTLKINSTIYNVRVNNHQK
jgi:hypothetical protein